MSIDFSGKVWVGVFVFASFLLITYALFIGSPVHYPVGALITIPPGATITEAGQILKEKNAIHSSTIFSIAVRLDKNSITAGSYLLSTKENVFTLAYRFSHGKTELAPVKVTIPEGTTVAQAGALFKNALGNFDTETFARLAKPDEGYLFPDTYFFFPGASAESVMRAMKDNFQDHVNPLEKQIQSFGRSESDVIIMASILEKEARQPETRRIVAGILWRRLAIGMPLQVDATFGYIFGTTTYSPSARDLLVDSPYNTYKYKGLPPGPIGNPGVETIQDAVTPITTPYLYYLTDEEGNIYYAKTYAEHLVNVRKIR